MATVASHKRLFTYYQCDGDDNRKYFQEFSAHVETLETYGGIGAIGITPTFLTAKLKELAALPLMPSIWPPSNWSMMNFLAVSCSVAPTGTDTGHSRLTFTTSAGTGKTCTLNPRTSVLRYLTDARTLRLGPLAPRSPNPLPSNRNRKLLCSLKVPQTRQAPQNKRMRGLRLLHQYHPPLRNFE
jgi:hypothetical protein